MNMRHIFLSLLVACICSTTYSQKLKDDYNQKATVSKDDSTIWLTANMKRDHRIFGYIKPDTNSKKMILISIFTNDVKGNPFSCPFGSYYQTSDMKNMSLKFVSKEGSFIKAKIVKKDSTDTQIFILRKWIEFEK